MKRAKRETDPVLKALDRVIEFIRLMREEKRIANQEFTFKKLYAKK